MSSVAFDGQNSHLPPPIQGFRSGNERAKARAAAADQTARLALEVAHKLKADFAANLSHEIREPLDTISGLSRFLGSHERSRLTDADIVDYARLIDGAAKHLVSFLNGILDLAKLESGECALKMRELRLDGILAAAAANLEDSAHEAGIKISLRMSRELPVVRGDAAKIYEVFVRVLTRAIEASERGRVVLIEASATPGEGAAVFVRDAGAGTSAEEIAMTLKPLGHLDSSRIRWREGARLGLRVAKAYVELHGGRFSMHSAEGRGTEVALLFPPAPRATLAPEAAPSGRHAA